MSYAPKLLRKDGLLDWSCSAVELERLIRAYSPWPGTFTTFRDGKGKVKNLKVHPQTEVVAVSGAPGAVMVRDGNGLVVACGDGGLWLTMVQPEGGKMMTAEEFLRGNSALSGQILGE